MPTPIYSLLFYAGHDLGGTYEIPLDPDYVWVLRDIDIFFPGDSAAVYANVIDAATNGTLYSVEYPAVGPAGSNNAWRGRQVFNPITGSPTIIVQAGSTVGDGPDVRISGYRLTPPA